MYIKSDHKNNTFTLSVLAAVFFMWGLISVLNGLLLERYMIIFPLTVGQIYLLHFSFMGAYLFMSFPSAWLIKTIGYRKSMVVGTLLTAMGCLLFFLMAHLLSYYAVIMVMFIIGSGITILQVAANPYITLLGQRGYGASKLTFVQAFNALGVFIGPFFAHDLFMSWTGYTSAQMEHLDYDGLKRAIIDYVDSPYLLLSIMCLLLALFILISRIPKLYTQEAEPLVAGRTSQDSIFRFRHVVLGSIGVFVYVGAEITLGKYINHVTQHSLTQFQWLVPLYWGGAMAGRFLGAGLLRFISPRKLMTMAPVFPIVLLLLAILIDKEGNVIVLAFTGFFNAVLFPCIFAMGIDGMGKLSNRASALLNTAIAGGAVMPLLFGILSDYSNTVAYLMLILAYVYIISYGLWGSRYAKHTNFY